MIGVVVVMVGVLVVVLGMLGVHVHLLILNCMCRHILDVAVRPIPTEKNGRCKSNMTKQNDTA